MHEASEWVAEMPKIFEKLFLLLGLQWVFVLC